MDASSFTAAAAATAGLRRRVSDGGDDGDDASICRHSADGEASPGMRLRSRQAVQLLEGGACRAARRPRLWRRPGGATHLPCLTPPCAPAVPLLTFPAVPPPCFHLTAVSPPPHLSSSRLISPHPASSLLIPPHPASSRLISPHPASSLLISPHRRLTSRARWRRTSLAFARGAPSLTRRDASPRSTLSSLPSRKMCYSTGRSSPRASPTSSATAPRSRSGRVACSSVWRLWRGRNWRQAQARQLVGCRPCNRLAPSRCDTGVARVTRATYVTCVARVTLVTRIACSSRPAGGAAAVTEPQSQTSPVFQPCSSTPLPLYPLPLPDAVPTQVALQQSQMIESVHLNYPLVSACRAEIATSCKQADDPSFSVLACLQVGTLCHVDS